jgi:hypothetical protein
LEVAKLVVSALTPIAVAIIGVQLARTARRVEEVQWANRKVVERRLELYELMAPNLNDLFCFFMLVGHFAEITPPDALGRKRALDRALHAHAPLFSHEFRARYEHFVGTCFLHFVGVAEPPQLRTSPVFQRTERGVAVWRNEWDAMFAPSDKASSTAEIASTYDALMTSFAEELGVQPGTPPARPWMRTIPLSFPSET